MDTLQKRCWTGGKDCKSFTWKHHKAKGRKSYIHGENKFFRIDKSSHSEVTNHHIGDRFKSIWDSEFCSNIKVSSKFRKCSLIRLIQVACVECLIVELFVYFMSLNRS